MEVDVALNTYVILHTDAESKHSSMYVATKYD